MPKYIDVDQMLKDEGAAYKAAQRNVKSGLNRRVNSMIHIKLQLLLNDAPAADVQEVKHAIWFRDPKKHNCWCCSHCGKFAMSDCHLWLLTNYCPHCGAKMEEEK